MYMSKASVWQVTYDVHDAKTNTRNNILLLSLTDSPRMSTYLCSRVCCSVCCSEWWGEPSRQGWCRMTGLMHYQLPSLFRKNITMHETSPYMKHHNAWNITMHETSPCMYRGASILFPKTLLWMYRGRNNMDACVAVTPRRRDRHLPASSLLSARQGKTERHGWKR